MEAERLGLDRHVEIVAKPLPGLRTEIAGVGLRRTENSEAHRQHLRPVIPGRAEVLLRQKH